MISGRLRSIDLRRPTESPRIFRAKLGRLLVLAADRFIDFPTMDGDVLRGFDAELHFVAADVDDGDHHVVADDDALVASSGKNKHGGVSQSAVGTAALNVYLANARSLGATREVV
jgi:hypothetical protein